MKGKNFIGKIFALCIFTLAVFFTSASSSFAKEDISIDLSRIEGDIELAGRTFSLWKVSDEGVEADLRQARLSELESLSPEELDKKFGEGQVTDKSDKAGKVSLSLDDGTYYLRDMSTDKKVLVNPLLISIPDDFISNDRTIYPKYRPRVREILLKKVDEEGKSLAGAVFRLYQIKKGKEEPVGITGSSYDPNGDKALELSTDGEGEIRISGLPDGKYIFREVAPPDGYEIIDQDTSFEISGDGTKTIEVVNRKSKLARLSLIKVDGKDNKALAGAKFRLTRHDPQTGKDLPVKVDGKELILTSDEEGRFEAKDLEYGDYRLWELEAPKGYQVLTNPIDIKVDEESYEHIYRIKNYKKTTNTNTTTSKNDKTVNKEFPKTGSILLAVSILAGSIFILLGSVLVRRSSREDN